MGWEVIPGSRDHRGKGPRHAWGSEGRQGREWCGLGRQGSGQVGGGKRTPEGCE